MVIVNLSKSNSIHVKEVKYEDIKDTVFCVVPESDYDGLYKQVMHFYSYNIWNADGTPVYNALRTIKAFKDAGIPFIFTIHRQSLPGVLKVTVWNNSIQEIPVYKLIIPDEDEKKRNEHTKKSVLKYLFTNPKLDAECSVTLPEDLLDQVLDMLYSDSVKLSDLESTRNDIWSNINSAYLKTISNRIR